MKQIAQLFLVLPLSLCISQTASAQITAEWDNTYWDFWSEWVFFSNNQLDTKILHRPFRVTSGSGYIDMTATLYVSGNSATTTTRMWVEEGIVYEADLWFDPDSSRDVYPGDTCYSIIFNSPALDAPGQYQKFPVYREVLGVPHWSCPDNVTITAQDEIQLNASDGTFADHVRITWNEMQGATGYQVFRCTGAFHRGVGGHGEDSVCGEAIGSTQGNGFDDTGGIDEKSYWYKVKVCTAGGCGDFSKADDGYRSDGQDDHGNSCAEATPVGSNSTNQGIIENPGNWMWADKHPESRDVDFFRIDLASVASLTVNTTGSNSTSGTLWDDECTEISTSSFGGDGENFLINEELAIGTYYVSVDGGEGPYEFVSSFEPISAPPDPPAWVYASDGFPYDRIVINWDAVNLASAYNIYISDTLDSTQIYEGQLTNNHGVITGAEPGVIRYIWIYSVNANGESLTGNYDTGYRAIRPDATVPDAPTLTSVVSGNGQVTLYFSANDDGGSDITGYTASCGAINQAGASSPITVSGLTNDTEYSCSVIASNAEGDSASSNVLFVTPILKELIYSDGFEAKTN